MKFDFSKRNIVVLGSSKGIGFATAKALVNNNANVCIVGRNQPALEYALTRLNPINKSHNNISVCCDLTDESSIDNLWQQITTKWNGEVDSLILNAGGPPLMKSVIDVTKCEWLTYFQSLFISQTELVKRSLKCMQEKKFGRIVSLSSASIVEVLPGLVISGAIRASLAIWLKSLANEVAKDGININTIVLGKIDTERVHTLDKNRADHSSCSLDEIKQANYKNIPTGRYGNPDEVANLVTFLLSSESSYINGSTITIDGGAIKTV